MHPLKLDLSLTLEPLHSTSSHKLDINTNQKPTFTSLMVHKRENFYRNLVLYRSVSWCANITIDLGTTARFVSRVVPSVI
ncbi:unnamed protein product [Protopolystoma xenopodis]|uniref:Uncharacterized protein n=1 Tax=Protopolystoma xenopodis TaxID=117903 RepID=A0A3S5BS52_9PLAT|nr:unnamed protein product [Protopolystoma xenopodis]